MRRWFPAFAAVGLVALLGACSGGDARSGATPEAVVRSAADRTLAQTAAQVEAAAPDSWSSARLRLSDPESRLKPTGPGAAKDYPELRHPLAVVDLVRGALEVVPYGGTAVRDASTFRYETVVDVELAVRATPESRRPAVRALADRMGAPAFYADVWVDGEGRIRRVQLPVEKTTHRPGSRDRSRPRLVTVDLFAFEP